MFCHTCEQYFSLPSDDNLSDEMAEAIQRHILRSWRACRRHPRSYEARSNAMWDSTFALNRVISRGKRRIGSRTASSMRSPPTSTSRTAPAWPWSIRTG